MRPGDTGWASAEVDSLGERWELSPHKVWDQEETAPRARAPLAARNISPTRYSDELFRAFNQISEWGRGQRGSVLTKTALCLPWTPPTPHPCIPSALRKAELAQKQANKQKPHLRYNGGEQQTSVKLYQPKSTISKMKSKRSLLWMYFLARQGKKGSKTQNTSPSSEKA